MAINVQYGPDANLLGALALQAGLGQYAQRQQQFQQQAALQAAAIAARQAEAKTRATLARDQFEESKRQAEIARIDAINQRRLAEPTVVQPTRPPAGPQLRPENWQNWEIGSVENLEKDIAALRAEDAKKAYTPEGQRISNELTGQLRAIQKQRAKLRPQAYNQLLGQWLKRYEQSGLQHHALKEPTPQEIWEERTVKLPDGSIAIFEPDGKGGGKFNRMEMKSNDPLADDGEYKDVAKSLREQNTLAGKPPSQVEPKPNDVYNEILRRRAEKARVAKLMPIIESLEKTGSQIVKIGEDGRLLVQTPWVPGQGSTMKWISPDELAPKSDTVSVNEAIQPQQAPAAVAQELVNSGVMSPEAAQRLFATTAPGSERPGTGTAAKSSLESEIRGLMRKYRSYQDMSEEDRQRLGELKAAYDSI